MNADGGDDVIHKGKPGTAREQTQPKIPIHRIVERRIEATGSLKNLPSDKTRGLCDRTSVAEPIGVGLYRREVLQKPSVHIHMNSVPKNDINRGVRIEGLGDPPEDSRPKQVIGVEPAIDIGIEMGPTRIDRLGLPTVPAMIGIIDHVGVPGQDAGHAWIKRSIKKPDANAFVLPPQTFKTARQQMGMALDRNAERKLHSAKMPSASLTAACYE